MKLFVVSLGCDKNLVDTEFMLGIIDKHGYVITDDESEADVIIVNTCCFIHDAMQESIDTILEMAQYKEQNCKALIVCGCLAQRFADDIREEIPEVDAVIGTASYDRIAEAIENTISGGTIVSKDMLNRLPMPDVKRMLTTPGHFAYLKIAEGCNKCCTYCIIPKIRGPFRSYPIERIVSEAEELARDGVKELILVAQETTVYGTDIYGTKMLPKLLKRLCDIEGIRWIRLLYAYPEEITDELIEVMASEPKICHYIDMPVQHASDAVLKRMGRRTSEEELYEIIEKLRNAMPDIAIRTTLISGFPGESEEDFEELYNFVDEVEFARLGVFTYSQEENTPAYDMPNQIDEEVKRARCDELMQLQQEIAFEKAETMVGMHLEVIVDGYLPDDDVYVCRTYMDAPDVDGMLFMSTDRRFVTGDMTEVEVIGANGYDLEGRCIDESAE